MDRREVVLTKLHSLSSAEINEAISHVTRHVQARMRFNSVLDRTKSGAHGVKNLGMDAIDYYVGESIKRLYGGWDWKFETLTLGEQLVRIANKLISDRVQIYKDSKEELPNIVEEDISDIYGIKGIAEIESNEEGYSELVRLCHELSKDDDNLHYYVMSYFEGKSAEEIAGEMGIKKTDVYVLRKKLVRKLLNKKAELTA
jgi:hypothetical protein